ncbi:hypothetical protein QBC32DRAFT_386346 [Pseudoneurospora amorphoporcata]|uniref:Uncharacterized protein n=1 Tax=Pseudoneurospora amorphoporcata TaxID=241081 RepID=A0AAN6NJK1_9PEZI|nr:hypothetical protein QBC32DRAFT_386346 [Pseudoneurospora amorphoporcata]
MVPISDYDAGRHITIFPLQMHAMSRPDGHSAALHASPPHQPTGLTHNHSIITPNTNTIALLAPGEPFTFDDTANPAAGSDQTSFFSNGTDSNASMVTAKDYLDIPIGVGEIDHVFFDEARKAAEGPNDGFGLDWEDTPTGDIGRLDHLPIEDLWNDGARKRRKGYFGIGFKNLAASCYSTSSGGYGTPARRYGSSASSYCSFSRSYGAPTGGYGISTGCDKD